MVHSPVIGLGDCHHAGVHRRGLTIAFDGREALSLLIEAGRSGKSRRLELGEGDCGSLNRSNTCLHRGNIYPVELFQLLCRWLGAKRCRRICRHHLIQSERIGKEAQARDPPVICELVGQCAGFVYGPDTRGSVSFGIRHFGQIIQRANGVNAHIELDRAHAGSFNHAGAFRPAIRI